MRRPGETHSLTCVPASRRRRQPGRARLTGRTTTGGPSWESPGRTTSDRSRYGVDACPGLLAFAAVATIVIVTPGQETALTVRNTLTAGRQAGIRTAAGAVCGQAVWALAASAGLAAVLVAWEPAFVALRLAGAAYLIYLGGCALLAAVRRRGAIAHGTPAEPRGRAWRQGLLSNLANPKMAVFFTSLLPQFGDSFAALLGLGLLFCALTMLWLTAYAVAVARAGDVLRHARVRRAIDAVTGVALVGFGVRLATRQTST